MRLLHLPDELLRHVLLQCTLSTLRRLKQACAQLRGEGRSMLLSAAWQATPHGAELGQPAWQGQATGRFISSGHMDCFGEFRGWYQQRDSIKAIVRCGQHLMVLTSGHTPGVIRVEYDGFKSRNQTPLILNRAIIGQGSWPQAFAADDKHVYVLHNGTESSGTDTGISSFVYADVLSPKDEYDECYASTPGPSSSLAGLHAVARDVVVNTPWLPRFAIDGGFTRLRASCADGRLYVACSYSRCVVVLSTTDLSQLMVFDASRATPAQPAAEQAALGAPTVGVGADEIEVIGEERGGHVPMDIAVGEQFVFVAQRSCSQGTPDCVAVYHKGTGELSHAIELHDLGVEAVAVHHETLYVLSTGLDERIAGAHHAGHPAPPANAAHDAPPRQPLLSWMGLRGERRGPEQQVSLLPDGYDGEAVRVAHGSMYVDGLRDTLIVTLDADHELGGHSLCIPLSLGGASNYEQYLTRRHVYGRD